MIKSSENGAVLLELYTSQGCYSCPPAEKWLNKLTKHKGLWSEIIPINLHVDYWDYLGWRDPFARPEFSKRQRLYQRFGHAHNIATPGFVVNGKGWNGWFRGHNVSDRPLNGKGELEAQINGMHLNIAFSPDTQNFRAPYAHVAILGFGIETEVPKGENAGKTLEHDFVVVGYQKSKMERKDDKWDAFIYKPHTVNVEMDKQAIVFWITELDDPAPLQAAANWL